ncbi:MAG: hypothetical protein ACYTHM_11780, partial [Planctomycetota bacterium]
MPVVSFFGKALIVFFGILQATGAGASENPIRILLADRTLKEGRFLASTNKGIEVFLEGEIRFIPWREMDPAQQILLRAARLDHRPPAPVRDRYELALDCRHWDLLEYGRQQLLRIQEERPAMTPVVRIWLREYTVTPTSADLARGIDAFFLRKDNVAYERLQKAAQNAPEGRERDIAKKFITLLIDKLKFRPPTPDRDPPLDRALNLKYRKIREYVDAVGEEIAKAKVHCKGGSITQMRHAFQRAEETLNQAVILCAQVLATNMKDRAKAIFTNLQSH